MFRQIVKSISAAALLVSSAAPAALAWEPTQTIELVVPAGTGGGGDQLARKIVEIIEAEKLTTQKVEVKNMSLISGAQGYLHVKSKKGDNHTLLITLASLFTLPIARKTEFHWKDMTPLARLAMDEFVLWVSAESDWKTAKDFVNAAGTAEKRMGGTGSAQEDQIVTQMLAKSANVNLTYVPFSGGGEVAKKLAGKFIDASVNNPSEADKLWAEGKLRPLGVFDSKRMAFAGDRWKEIPTMKEQGYNVEYLMLRGVFGPGGMSADAKKYYIGLLEKVSKSPAFKAYLKDGALVDGWLTGKELEAWLAKQDDLHAKMLEGVVLQEVAK